VKVPRRVVLDVLACAISTPNSTPVSSKEQLARPSPVSKRVLNRLVK